MSWPEIEIALEAPMEVDALNKGGKGVLIQG